MLYGLTLHLCSTTFVKIVQLYVINSLNRTPEEYASQIFSLRYWAIFACVTVVSPFGSMFAAARVLRWAGPVTAVIAACMAFAPYTLFRYLSAAGGASSSVAMVFLNALIQRASYGNTDIKVRLNMEYRILAATCEVFFPWFVTSVLVPLLSPAGYPAAFLFSGMAMALSSLLLDRRFELLHTPTTSPDTDKAASTIFTLLCMHSMMLPTHGVDTFAMSQFKALGATPSFVGRTLAVAASVGIGALAAAQHVVPWLSAPIALSLIRFTSGLAMFGMGSAATPLQFAGLYVLHTVVGKVAPVTNSMWLSLAVPQACLPSMFAVEKATGTALRALLSIVFAWLVARVGIPSLLRGCSLWLLAVCPICIALIIIANRRHKASSKPKTA
ncbi:hypothetical protein PTSG_04367 [Salpingoeca rosetta]|uniref:Major facilitator superfamily associated domain-containing protein n=1 Tax=Salpingoeca rosetta (strain ATCC 50818 / BSB-021) TaxID=946362 RepID=F2U8C4_SALR5|nr:uncharacterized protein PTSG_04367 [Salpingoeca rosetta]EGD72632.1 hypothetical protein PTSG_04367 [Salpingoeca rosetta]|eukprot:XP_004994455.1 hypothetical protein PTSG_04367 [Salpingoeca rosetta]